MTLRKNSRVGSTPPNGMDEVFELDSYRFDAAQRVDMVPQVLPGQRQTTGAHPASISG